MCKQAGAYSIFRPREDVNMSVCASDSEDQSYTDGRWQGNQDSCRIPRVRVPTITLRKLGHPERQRIPPIQRKSLDLVQIIYKPCSRRVDNEIKRCTPCSPSFQTFRSESEPPVTTHPACGLTHNAEMLFVCARTLGDGFHCARRHRAMIRLDESFKKGTSVH